MSTLPLRVDQATTFLAAIRLHISATTGPLLPSRKALVVWKKDQLPRDESSEPFWKRTLRKQLLSTGEKQFVYTYTYFSRDTGFAPVVWSELITVCPGELISRRDIIRMFWTDVFVRNCIARSELQLETSLDFFGLRFGERGLPQGLVFTTESWNGPSHTSFSF